MDSVKLLLDLRQVAVAVDPVGSEVLGDAHEREAVPSPAPGARHAGLRIDHNRPDQPGACQRSECQDGGGGIAARVGDQLGAADLLTSQLGEPVHRVFQQLGLSVRPVPALVDRGVDEAKVGGEVDDRQAQPPHSGNHGRRRSVRVGDDRGVDVLDLVQVELRQLDLAAVARIQVAEPTARIRARGRVRKLERRVSVDELGRERARVTRGPGDHDAAAIAAPGRRSWLLRRLVLSHGATLRSPQAPTRCARERRLPPRR
jgi:hypothetical protein